MPNSCIRKFNKSIFNLQWSIHIHSSVAALWEELVRVVSADEFTDIAPFDEADACPYSFKQEDIICDTIAFDYDRNMIKVRPKKSALELGNGAVGVPEKEVTTLSMVNQILLTDLFK